jgi:hypothetical protein
MAIRSVWLFPTLAVMAGCAAMRTDAPPVPTVAVAPLPDSRYTQEPLPGGRGGAAWRPATVENVLDLDGQPCTVVDLGVRCSAPAPAAAALAADAATVATESVTTDVDAIDSGSVE